MKKVKVLYEADEAYINKEACKNLIFRHESISRVKFKLFYFDDDYIVRSFIIDKNNYEQIFDYNVFHTTAYIILRAYDLKSYEWTVNHHSTIFYYYKDLMTLYKDGEIYNNGTISQMLFKRLNENDNPDEVLPELVKTTKVYSHEGVVYEDLERCTVLRPTYVRSQPNTFDYIYISISLPSDNANIEFIKSHKKNLDKMILDKLHSTKTFMKYDIPDNFLRIERCTFTKDNRLEYVIGLKMNEII